MIKDSMYKIWTLSRKNVSLYIKSGPVIIFGLMFPFFMTLSWVLGREISVNQIFIGIIAIVTIAATCRDEQSSRHNQQQANIFSAR